MPRIGWDDCVICLLPQFPPGTLSLVPHCWLGCWLLLSADANGFFTLIRYQALRDFGCCMASRCAFDSEVLL
jgi:hypothetical protein